MAEPAEAPASTTVAPAQRPIRSHKSHQSHVPGTNPTLYNMKNHILFIQGGGNGGYEEDMKLVSSLRKELGKDYEVKYPQLKAEELPDFGWPHQISKEIAEMKDNVFLVAHSVGASMLLKCLSERAITKKIAGIFLIATPFWEGDEEWKAPLKLRDDFASRLPQGVPIFMYHAKDDEEVPFTSLSVYAAKLPHATTVEIARGGHQLNDDLSMVARDIKAL